MGTQNEAHRTASVIKTVSVVVLTAAELQADKLTVTVTGPQKK